MSGAASYNAKFCTSCGRKRAGNQKARLQARLKVTQQCSLYGCRKGTASLRARFCTACFRKNAAAVGGLRGNRQKIPKTCSREGCTNDVQGSRCARFRPACVKKNHGKVAKSVGKRSALLSHQVGRWVLVLKNFLKCRGICLVDAKQGCKIHAFVMT